VWYYHNDASLRREKSGGSTGFEIRPSSAYMKEVTLMATFEVTIEKITVHPHPNADRLDFAQVGLYNVVVPKGQYVTGDEVFYIPEFSILPETLINRLGLEGKLSGKNKDRVKPTRLRGLLSQGLVAPLEFLDGEIDRDVRDFSTLLGIKKWEPEIPSALSGEVDFAPELVRWIDIENIKKFPEMFTEGEHVVIDEKVHGTATCVTVVNPNKENRKVYVTSKGIGSKNLSLKEDERNVYWKMFHRYNLLEFTQLIADRFPGTEKVAVFGETYGSIQDLHYGMPKALGFILFDIHVTRTENSVFISEWIDPELTEEFAQEAGVPLAPRLFDGPYSLETVTALASGPEQVSGTEANIREGVVVRPAASNSNKLFEGSRRIGKFVSEDYLTRSNGTEYN
jgi:RNA ligase (TIGR02306 family)